MLTTAAQVDRETTATPRPGLARTTTRQRRDRMGPCRVPAGFLLGALLGASIVAYVPTAVVRIAFGSLLLFVGFQFLLNAFGTRPASALPVLLITAFNWIFARLVQRRRVTPFRRISPPGDDTE